MHDHALISQLCDEIDKVQLAKRTLQRKLMAIPDEELWQADARNTGEYLVALTARLHELRERLDKAIHIHG